MAWLTSSAVVREVTEQEVVSKSANEDTFREGAEYRQQNQLIVMHLRFQPAVDCLHYFEN